ncbi:MAG: LacI family DNA-binding transcriptional regulator [Chitinophagaceae bacterium]
MHNGQFFYLPFSLLKNIGYLFKRLNKYPTLALSNKRLFVISKMKKVSLKDVAQRASVSTALVSYVINNRLEERINKETAERVRKAVRELGYQPNRIAQSLKLQRTLTLGFIVPDIANTFSSCLARLIEDAASKNRYTLLIGSSDEKEEKQQALIDLFLNRQVDGLIIGAAEGTERQLEALLLNKMPVVLIDRYFPSLPIDGTIIDNYGASLNAIEHLIRQGRKKIAIVAYDTQMFHLQERVRGYRDTMHKNQLAVDNQWIGKVATGQAEVQTPEIIEQFFAGDNTPDAVFFISNSLAVAGLKKLVAMNIYIPDQLAVVAFDETEAFDLFDSPVTFIRQPLDLLARNAVNCILNRIQHPEGAVQLRQFPTELVIRKSSTPSTRTV